VLRIAPGASDQRESATVTALPAQRQTTPRRIPSETREETLEALRRARTTADPQERQHLQEQVVVAHMKCAHSMAARFRGRGVDYDDLVQVAYLGLVKAASGCDPDRCADFLQYATPTILGEIKRHFRDHAWSVRPPRRLQEMQPQVNQARTSLTQDLGRQPTNAEVAEALGVNTDQVDEAVMAGQGFSTMAFDPLVDSYWHPSSDDPELSSIEDMDQLSALFARLSDRERKVVLLRYYLGWTQAEIGSELGLSQMQISRTLRGAMNKLAAPADNGSEAA
jgi:RNA polymerase sigma-B factor